MRGAEYIVDILTSYGATDVFGIPGAIVLDFLYAVEKNDKIQAHLNYHEQAAAFAALGYAQSSGKLGVTYSTRGPGVTNMMTGIAEAYFESVPVMFLTAHSNNVITSERRSELDQEVDFSGSISTYSKFSIRIDSLEELVNEIPKACEIALEGRKGPVFVDVSANLFREEVALSSKETEKNSKNETDTIEGIISEKLNCSKRPVVLIGDGLRNTGMSHGIAEWAMAQSIPILSSRGAQDLVAGTPVYYGYIGSHGLRYSNFILSKCDLIICIGNRVSFPLKSESYKSICKRAQIIRFDIDENELERAIPNSEGVLIDLRDMKPLFDCQPNFDYSEWLHVCQQLFEQLSEYDITPNVSLVADFLKNYARDVVLVSDVGNNEFYLSRAYAYATTDVPLLISKSFGTLGVAIAKSIGAYYATRKHVVCFIGDQGFQYNIQELQFISGWNLPVTIVVMNNRTSGMIKDKEIQKYGNTVHTTKECGYYSVNVEIIAGAYNLPYHKYQRNTDILLKDYAPGIIEMELDPEEKMIP